MLQTGWTRCAAVEQLVSVLRRTGKSKMARMRFTEVCGGGFLSLCMIYVAAGLFAQEQPSNASNADSQPTPEDTAPKRTRFDSDVVATGQAAFNRACTTCHDAARALERRESLSAWRVRV